MSWFKRLKEGISTATRFKKDAPDGLWHKCKKCENLNTYKELLENYYKCTNCNYHYRISSESYFDILFDNSKYTRLFDELVSKDFLNFKDLKVYSERLKEAIGKTRLLEAMSVATGRCNGIPLICAAMDFKFIGGSMGSVVGEKIARAIELSLETRHPLLIISKSGGARMMESAFSLMQMAKTSAMLAELHEARIPYISILTDPTTGGVTASFAMLGDFNIAEPGALIGFAGPRVIRETIKQELPENFQSAESVLEHGFLDKIVDRKDLKKVVSTLLSYTIDEVILSQEEE